MLKATRAFRLCLLTLAGFAVACGGDGGGNKGGDSGSCRLRARRFPVPEGTIVRGTPVPVSASATARTVPSPPATSTASAPSCLKRP